MQHADRDTARSNPIAAARSRFYRWLGETWAERYPDDELFTPIDSYPTARRTPDIFQIAVAFVLVWFVFVLAGVFGDCSPTARCSYSVVEQLRANVLYLFGPVCALVLICCAIRRIWNTVLDGSGVADAIRVLWAACLILLFVCAIPGLVMGAFVLVGGLLEFVGFLVGMAHTVASALAGAAAGMIITDVMIWRDTRDAPAGEPASLFVSALRAARGSFISLTVGLLLIAVSIQALPLPAIQRLVVLANGASIMTEHWLALSAWLLLITLAVAALLQSGAVAQSARVFRRAITVRGWFSRAFALGGLLAGIALSSDAVNGDTHDRLVDLTLRENKYEQDIDSSRAALVPVPHRQSAWSSRDDQALTILARDFALALGSAPALRHAQDAAWSAAGATDLGPASHSNHVAAGLARIDVGRSPDTLTQRIETRLRNDIAKRFPGTWSELRERAREPGVNPDQLKALLLDQFLDLALDKSIKFENGLAGDVAGATVTDISKSSLTTVLDRAYDRFRHRLMSPSPDPAAFATPLDIPITRSEKQYADLALGTLASVKAQTRPHAPSAIELRETETGDAIVVGSARATVTDGAELAVRGMAERVAITKAAESRPSAELLVDILRFVVRAPK